MQTKKIKKDKNSRVYAIFARAGVIALFSVYPLIVTDSYFNITKTKAYTFIIIAFAALFLCLDAKLLSPAKTKITPHNKTKNITPTDIAFICFIAVSVLSCVCSPYKGRFTAAGDRYFGLIIYLAFAAAYIFITRFYTLQKTDIAVFAVCACVVFLTGILQVTGLDIFGLYNGVPQDKANIFLSFMGNINVYASFICTAVPLVMYIFCHTKQKLFFVLSLMSCITGFFALFLCNSDSGYIGFAAAFTVLLFISANDKKAVSKVFLLLAVFALCCFTVNIAYRLFDTKLRPLSTLTAFISAPVYSLTLTGIASVTAAAFYFMPEKFYKKRLLKIITAAVSLLGIAAAVTATVYFTKINTGRDLGIFSGYLRFTDNWGSDRGFVWKRLLGIYSDLPFTQKLIGTGQDSIYRLLCEHCSDEMTAFGLPFDNAHNDYIQYLVTGGALTLAAYLGIVICSIRVYKNNFAKAPVCYKALLPALAAFLCQAFFNITQPITTPYIFILLSLMNTQPTPTGKKGA